MQQSFDIGAALQSREAKFRQKIREDRLRLERLKNVKSDYETLGKTLTSIMEKRKHNVMVPVGEKAFMRGILTNTNQVTVAIGDDYFIKCSIKHALQIIGRRIKLVEENIKKFEDEFNFLKKQLGLTPEILDVKEKFEGEDIVEIREEYHSDEELELQTNPVPERKPKIEVISSTVTETEKEDEDEFLKVINNLAELEMAEETAKSGKKRKSQFHQNIEDTKRLHTETKELNEKPEQLKKKHFGTPLEKEEKKKPFYTLPTNRDVALIPQKTTTQGQKPKKRYEEDIFSSPIEDRDIIKPFDFSDQTELNEPNFLPLPSPERDVVQPSFFPQEQEIHTNASEEDTFLSERDILSRFPLQHDLIDVNNPGFPPPQVQQQKVSHFKAQQQKLKQRRNEK